MNSSVSRMYGMPLTFTAKLKSRHFRRNSDPSLTPPVTEASLTKVHWSAIQRSGPYCRVGLGKARCFWMLSMLWQCCLLVVRRYFCRARAMEGNIARAASRTSMMSDGVARSSSFFIRRTCVKASSTATTSLTKRRHTHGC
ncbi:hypothetical protein EYF80_036293 [Liparis tanakae]|uniref:Uncharacterized protein n=1 Tax=Liparis tanakae TaxID=230148 RepID=A0A4Z2GJV3_9TELE|nr:hypothetical protein EYF80_036293 [Liparis tanakae]